MATFQGLNNDERSSSRVLKPPGGGHSNIFGAPDTVVSHARPKYDQQNSSNISGALGTTDANVIAEATARDIQAKQSTADKGPEAAGQRVEKAELGEKPADSAQTGRGRVPPGGFSAGFW